MRRDELKLRTTTEIRRNKEGDSDVKNAKNALVSLLSSLGVIALLVGILTDLLSFGVGLIIAIVFWIASGMVATMFKVKKE